MLGVILSWENFRSKFLKVAMTVRKLAVVGVFTNNRTAVFKLVMGSTAKDLVGY